MILLSWNCRGLGARIKRNAVRKLIQKNDPHLIFIQESKLESISPKVMKSICDVNDMNSAISPSNGPSGGLISIWKNSFFMVEESRCECNWIILTGSILSINMKCRFINLYNPCDVQRRTEVWRELIQICESSPLPCLFIGDFNEVLEASERGSQHILTNSSTEFKDFLQVLHLIEIPSSNSKFTWFRGQSKSKLDRVFVQAQWISAYPLIRVSHLQRGLSDHCPILVQSKEKNWGPRPFRFLNCWLSHPGCMKTISDTWAKSQNMTFMDKLRLLKTNLKKWNAAEFGIIEEKISFFENKIHEYDLIANNRMLDKAELEERKAAQIELWQWSKRNESFWAQHSRAKWIREGDRNTRYFHVMASIRRRKNNIEYLKEGEHMIEDPTEIKMAATNFFKNLFTEEHEIRPVFEGLDFKRLGEQHEHILTDPFSTAEIDAAVAACDSSKSPGPDGFNFMFIKNSWDLIKEDIYAIVFEFWQTSHLPKGCNTALVALIPKTNPPNGFKDFRPISMIGCVYKIISKILARRLQQVMAHLVGSHQSAFIKGRQILDGALIAGEVIESCKRNKVDATIFKIDFHKAFDSVSWGFMEWTLTQMNFPKQWREWIRACVLSASASILINGSPTSPIKLRRGLRQGDPLSPFLFTLIAEPLNLLIKKAVSLSLWEGVEICRGGLKITHLQYADDTVLFCPPKLEFLENIKRVLILFHLASGLQINFHKSSLMGINIEPKLLDHMASQLLCKVGSLPFVYLGLPIGGSASRINLWEPVIAKIEKKLASWKGNLLSIGGRVTLIKSCLASLPLYYMSLLPMPKGVIEKIIQLQRNFLWRGSLEKKALPLVSWNVLELPKQYGGLSIGNLHNKNTALLFKWLWRFIHEPNSLWRQIVQAKYDIGPTFTIRDLTTPPHGGPWRGICNLIQSSSHAYQIATHMIRKNIGDGSSTMFWHDVWVGEHPLKEVCPRLFLLSLSPNALVSSCGFWDGQIWHWSLHWKRNLRPQDRCERESLQVLLDRAVLYQDGHDQTIWTPAKSGKFSVKSFTLELAKKDVPQNFDASKGFWKGLVPFRIEIFVWFVLLGRLNTKEKLWRLGIVPESEKNCVLCNIHPESVNHLFMGCTVASELWLWWLSIWGVSWVFPSTLKSLHNQWHAPFRGSIIKKSWQAIFFIILWTIWKERNGRIFENKECSMSQLKDLILLRLSWWLKGWGDFFPYSSTDLLRNPQCLLWNSKPCPSNHLPSATAVESWSPPPFGSLKWNVDASCSSIFESSSIGGVLRDHNGNFICMFSRPIPFMEINNAEVLAIHRALKISASCERLMNLPIMIESDSVNAVKWCKQDKGGPWNMNFILNFIRGESRKSPGMSITYKGRASNMVADALAKQGLSRRDEFIAWL